MQLVVGLLPITLGLLMVSGCALTERDGGAVDRYGFRSKLKSKSDTNSSIDDRLSFRSPRDSKRSRMDASDSGSEESKSRLSKRSSKSSKKSQSPETASEIASNSTSTGTSIKSKRPANDPQIGDTATRRQAAATQVKGEWADDEPENPIQKSPVQLQTPEFESTAAPASQTDTMTPVETDPTRTTAAVNASNQESIEAKPGEPNQATSSQPGNASGNPISGTSPAVASPDSTVTQTNSVIVSANSTEPKGGAATKPTPWQAELNQMIAKLEQRSSQVKSVAHSDDDTDSLQTQAHLRLLYLMAHRQEEALTAIAGLNSSQQEYWQQLIWAMSTSLDTAQFPEASDRAAHMLPPLVSALRHVREEAPLAIRNLTFCKRISGFGNYDRFPRNEFSAGYEVLLYSEVENFTSAPANDGGFRTSLTSAIEIVDAGGNSVWKKNFATPTEDFCRNPRRDYFQNCHFHIPEDLASGAYVLKLAITDEISQKQAASSIKFILK